MWQKSETCNEKWFFSTEGGKWRICFEIQVQKGDKETKGSSERTDQGTDMGHKVQKKEKKKKSKMPVSGDSEDKVNPRFLENKRIWASERKP